MKAPFFFMTGKGKKKFELPTSWKEVTLRQFIEIVNTENIGNKPDVLLQILTGIDAKQWRRMKGGEIAFYEEKLTWISEGGVIDVKKLPIPKYLVLEGKQVEVPKELTEIPWGAHLDSKNLLENQDFFDSMPAILGAFLYCAYSGKKYDSEEADKLGPICEQLPCLEAYSVANFFLRMLLNYGKDGQKGLRGVVRQRRLRRVLKT